MKTKKILLGVILLSVSVLNPGCKHERPNAKEMYRQYIKSKVLPR